MSENSNPSSNKITLILIAVVILLLAGAVFAFQKISSNAPAAETGEVSEVDTVFDPDGAYALMTPRRDGNAVLLTIKRAGAYTEIKYELTYNTDGIDRAAVGEIKTQKDKGEYTHEILFGTCSTGGTCVYDKGVENGTLVLRMRKGNTIYKFVNQWHLQRPEVALGALTSNDNHFTYQVATGSADIQIAKFTIINDVSGAPKLPKDKTVLGKLYAINVPPAQEFPAGTVKVELAQAPKPDSKIARYSETDSKWVEYETKIDGNTLTASSSGTGVIAVLSSK